MTSNVDRTSVPTLPAHPEVDATAPRADANLPPAALQEAWSRYWARGAAHSCVGSYGECYGGAIARFWHDVFGGLPVAARVLDLATGNGALPRLILDQWPDSPIEVDAIDLAAIEPPWLARLAPATRARIRFHGGLPAEHLPFDDARFDWIISQYGLEYSDLERSIPEMLRVLAPRGRIALLMHHTDSRPVSLAAIELEHLVWLQSPSGLLHAADAMLEPMSRAATDVGRASLAVDSQAEAARERFNVAQDALRMRAAAHQDGADVLFEFQEAVSQVLNAAAQHGLVEACSRLSTAQVAARDLQLRLGELRRYALTADSMQAFGRRLQQAGSISRLTVDTVQEQGHLMGWTVIADAVRTSKT